MIIYSLCYTNTALLPSIKDRIGTLKMVGTLDFT